MSGPKCCVGHTRFWVQVCPQCVEDDLKDARRKVFEKCAARADQHECGGEDDICCAGVNCGMLIAADIRALREE